MLASKCEDLFGNCQKLQTIQKLYYSSTCSIRKEVKLHLPVKGRVVDCRNRTEILHQCAEVCKVDKMPDSTEDLTLSSLSASCLGHVPQHQVASVCCALCVPQGRLGVHAVQNWLGTREHLRLWDHALPQRHQSSVHAVQPGAEGELQLSCCCEIINDYY